MVDPALLAMYADPVSAAGESLDEAGRRVTAWAEDAEGSAAEGVVLGVSHEAPLIAAYLAGRGVGFTGFRMVNIPHLGGVRLLPGPPDIIDPAEALAPRC
jgi:broad specificity phosphatase PhoE